jgi:outer membrane protein assembly factor BamB
MPDHCTSISPARPWRRILAAAAVAGAVSAPGCESVPSARVRAPVATEQQDQSLQVDSAKMRQIGYERDWRGYPAIARGQEIRSLDLWDDLVLAHGTDSTITALEPRSGERRWSLTLLNPLTRFLGNVRDGNVIYSSTEGEVFALDVDTGNILDRLDNAQIVNTGPLRVGGLLIYGTATTTSSARGSERAEVIAFLPTGGIESVDGVKMWGTLTRGPVEQDLALVDGAVVAASRSGDVLFVNPATGSLLGRSSMYDGPGSRPVAGEGLVFIASRDQSIYAFRPTGGRAVWRFRTQDVLETQPAYHAGAVYVEIPSEGLIALGAATGERLWDGPSEARGTVIGMRDGLLLVHEPGGLATVDPRGGDVVERISMPGLKIAKAPQFEDGDLYLASDIGLIAKFVPAR